MQWSSRRVILLCIALTFISAAMTIVVMNRRSNDLVLRFEPIADTTTVMVYIGGAVTHPGLYTLPSGSRLATAIEKAGALDDADVSGLRMADPVQDKMTILVPHRAPAASSTSPVRVETSPTAATQRTATEQSGTLAPPSPASRLINVNTASLAELESLPGIGPALAQRIIDYRVANGPFATPDDLDAVKGISARMVDSFRSLITAGGIP